MQPHHPEQQPQPQPPVYQSPPAPPAPFYQQPPAYVPPPAPPVGHPQPAYQQMPPQPAPAQPVRSVTKARKDTSHTFHLLMTLFTCGMWLFVWVPIIIWHKMGPRRKAVTKHYG